MSNIYTSCFTDPYPNGWKNKDVEETTPIDAEALQAITDCIKEMDNFLNGVNKDRIGQVRKSVISKAQYDALPDSKYTDGCIYFVRDGSEISYTNYETEAF